MDYDTHLDIKYEPLERIDVQALADSATQPWWNQTLCRVDNSVVRLGVLQGEYHWHQHDEDEFFLVLDGDLIIDLPEGATIELGRRQAVVIPRGVQHRPRAPLRTTVVMVEDAAVVPTGV